jgi:TPR repeat protein
MPRRHPLAVLFIALTICGLSRAFAAPATPLTATDQARAAIARGDEREAFRIWSAAAAKGDREAQFGLGMMYDAGKGVAASPEQAATWYLRSAKQGHSLAQLYIGIFYMQNTGVKANVDEGLRWIELAAKSGLDEAQFTLGSMYARGDFVKKEPDKAVPWLEKAAQTGHTKSMGLLGSVYFDLWQRDQNSDRLVRGYAWGVVAAKHDAAQAGTSTLTIYRKYMSAADVAAGDRLAATLERRAFPAPEKPAR